MTICRTLFIASIAVLFVPAWSAAQNASSSTSSGGTTSSNTGGTFGGTSTGAGGGGGGGLGGGEGLTQPQLNSFGQAADTVGTGFVGRGNNEQAFVGATAAGQQTIDAGGTARFSGLGGGGGETGGGGDVSQARGGQMRIPLRVAFTVPGLEAPRIAGSLQTQFAALEQRLPGVTVQPSGEGHVLLLGTVPSEHARKLAEAIARLEPGVRKITNELEVASAGAEPTPLLIP